MKRLCMLSLAIAACAGADTGVLIPGNRQQPDPAVFSLNEMAIEVRIDNGTARVRVRQIFGNHTDNIKEGVYQFALPGKATVSDFAVWDDITRIPGVILERRRAGEIYEQAKSQAIDPGLLQMGERTASESGAPFLPSQAFTAHIVPIPPFGTKRIEMEYQHPVAVEQYRSELVVPLKPDVFGVQVAGRLTIELELHSAHAIRDFEAVSKIYPLQIRERAPNLVRAEFSGSNVGLNEDFAVRYTLDPSQADTLHVIAEREALSGPGFFQVQALLRMPVAGSPAPQSPRTLILLFDTSLSMQWDKLERGFAACEAALRRLRPADSFNLLLFNSEVSAFAPQPQPASAANIERALAFIRNSRIRGGTDLERALAAGLAQAAPSEPYLMLIGDGGATEGTVQGGRLAAWYAAEWSKRNAAQRPRTLVFGAGDDANLPLLQTLAAHNGFFEWVRSTEPVDFKLNAFLAKIGQSPLKGVTLTPAPTGNFDFAQPRAVRFSRCRRDRGGKRFRHNPIRVLSFSSITGAAAPVLWLDFEPEAGAGLHHDVALAKIGADSRADTVGAGSQRKFGRGLRVNRRTVYREGCWSTCHHHDAAADRVQDQHQLLFRPVHFDRLVLFLVSGERETQIMGAVRHQKVARSLACGVGAFADQHASSSRAADHVDGVVRCRAARQVGGLQRTGWSGGGV
ncbi:MAG: VIT and VWA domain-containing protein [Candidatus Sulfopaludibacter sp.]|nr:VIT and VWA domain-containing protein [Candidatus Sulfopaludibacter sp.]